MLVGLVWILGRSPASFFHRYGSVDELDFWRARWASSSSPSSRPCCSPLVFRHPKKGWEELHRGALIKVPKVFYYVLKYVPPSCCSASSAGGSSTPSQRTRSVPKPRIDYTVMDPAQVRRIVRVGSALRRRRRRPTSSADAGGIRARSPRR